MVSAGFAALPSAQAKDLQPEGCWDATASEIRGVKMIDFAALPPEINSARMYSGPGSAPMMAAASAWNALAAELGSAAASYASVVSTLAGDQWLGPASAS